MITVIRNLIIIPFTRDDYAFRGDIAFENGTIIYCDKQAYKGLFDKEIITDGKIALPSFKNAHSHAAMVFLKGTAENTPFNKWLFDICIPSEQKLTPHYVHVLSLAGFIDEIRGGISSSIDMYYFAPEIHKASEEIGMRNLVLGTIDEKKSPTYFKDIYQEASKDKYLSHIGFSLHAEYTYDDEWSKKASKLVHKLKLPFYTHNSENIQDVEGCLKRHGLTPTTYFASLGLYDYGGGLFHNCHMNDEDIDILKRNNLVAITCQGSNKMLNSGIAPLEKFKKQGIDIAIGTDGPASNKDIDMFYEMRLIKENYPSSFSSYEILKMATYGGSKAMLRDDLTSLEVGKKADILLLSSSLDKKGTNLFDNIISLGNKENVASLYIDGKEVFNGSKILTVDERKIKQEANNITSLIGIKA